MKPVNIDSDGKVTTSWKVVAGLIALVFAAAAWASSVKSDLTAHGTDIQEIKVQVRSDHEAITEQRVILQNIDRKIDELRK